MIDRAKDASALCNDISRSVRMARQATGDSCLNSVEDTPSTIYLAAKSGQADVVRTLLDEGHSPDDAREGDRSSALAYVTPRVPTTTCARHHHVCPPPPAPAPLHARA